MKKKIKIKGLPKAQFGNVPPVVLTPQQQQQWYKNQNMFGTPPAGPTPTAFNNPFSVNQPGFITSGTKNPNPTKSLSPSGMGPITADDYYANLAEQNTAAPAGTRFDANAAYAPGTPMPSDLDTGNWATIKGGLGSTNSKNPLSMLGPMLMGELAFVNSAINKIDQRDAQRKFKDQFLSDNMYLSRPESISGNRGDYDINTGMFRPDEYVYGKFNKIAQMGGEMKRKVKITGLPEAQYGGTQNRDAVNQLYGNSAYIMNMFSQRQEQEPMQEYNETLQPDPRSLSVIEAEKGETLIKTGENSTIPEFYKIGGKRHYEGGTPLGPDKATPNSFIYSDTKAMKIKDPELLSSFGLKAKKGGYTPAEISKKFNLNDKNLREGLYDEQDMLRKKTAIMNADKYISNLGKLALVQESKKGFPQGIPDIAVPYMEKIGLDPMSFMPDQSQQNIMDNYGNLPMAQRGGKPYTEEDIIFKDGKWQLKTQPTAPYKVPNYNNISPQYFQDITFGMSPQDMANIVIQRTSIPAIENKQAQEKQEFLNSLNKGISVTPSTSANVVTKPKVSQNYSKPTGSIKPKQETVAPSTGGTYTTPDGTVIDFEYGGIPMAQDGTQVNATGQILKTATDKSGNKFYSYLEGTDVVLRDESGKELQRRPATETDKPATQTYTDEEKKVLKSMAPNLVLPEDYVESLQKQGTVGTFGRFDKASADKNWGWYGKKIDWSNPNEVGAAQEKYNKEMYNRFTKAGYTPQEAARYVNMIGFDPNIDKGPNALDKQAGKYTETRVLFDVPPKPKKEPAAPDVREMDQNVDLSAKRPDRSRPIGLYPQDIVNTVGALQNLYGINKYMPRQVQFTPEYVEPTYYDPTREIAANAEMANIAAQNLAQFTGPQAFNARYSDVQGKGLANAANIMGRYNNLNVGVANQFEMANKQIANEANFKNALAADDFYTKTAIANQQYDNARRQGREAVQQNIVGAMDNYFNTKLMNELYPQYYISPSSLSVQYDPQAALKLKPKTQTGNLDARLESMFPGYSNLEEQDKNPLRIAMLKAFTGDTSDSKDAFAAAAVRSKKK
jgi:hypothetical protein